MDLSILNYNVSAMTYQLICVPGMCVSHLAPDSSNWSCVAMSLNGLNDRLELINARLLALLVYRHA